MECDIKSPIHDFAAHTCVGCGFSHNITWCMLRLQIID